MVPSRSKTARERTPGVGPMPGTARLAVAWVRAALPGGSELPQHVLQDPSVAVVLPLLRRIDSHAHAELPGRTVGPCCRDGDLRRIAAAQADDVEHLTAGEAERADVLPRQELQRRHAHADQVGTVNALEALGDHGFDTEEHGALGRPVARGPGAILASGEDEERRAFLLVAHGDLID